jgi:hypothetical protein
MGRFPDLEYVKTDLVASKGVAYAKYSRASSALRVVEAVAARGMVRDGFPLLCFFSFLPWSSFVCVPDLTAPSSSPCP